ncbi:transporter [uncultured Sphingomonas sp.]|uniref:transporter n=1 Tax=uncultured Sphingomonas sp. TaxID=158754 RepID=UPI0025D369B8|nr:transporter [uncultured Sphingomonas sp.]
MKKGIRVRVIVTIFAAALAAAPVMAQDGLRELCSDRPGLGTAPCTVDPGHVQVEAGIGSWERTSDSESRIDRIELGDVLVRYGVGDSTELRLDWLGYAHVRERDRATGSLERTGGVGDVTVGLKRNLTHPDGNGLSLALLPFATLPTGKSNLGDGVWSAGLTVPATYAINDTLTFELTPEIDAAANEDAHGRHLAYGSVAGVQAAVSRVMDVMVELAAIRDRDPAHHSTQSLLALSLAYHPGSRVQFDVGGNAGLNHNSPDVQLYLGVSEKF